MSRTSEENMVAAPRPRVVVSRCLGFDACRWNGERLRDPFVEQLRPFVEFLTFCPEVDIGLGVPRRPVRVVMGAHEEEVRLVQPSTGHDATDDMCAYAEFTAAKLEAIDGFLLKYRSPSCGPGAVKVYHSADGPTVARKGAGLFAEILREHFPTLPMEDEGRLNHFRIREHWLTRVFALARLRAVEASGRMRDLIDFHADHKYLLLAYHQEGMRRLGRIVAAGSDKNASETIAEYVDEFRVDLSEPPRLPTLINVLEHMVGHFSKLLEPRERQHFTDVMEVYRRGGLPLSVPTQLLKGWAIRFESDYILRQTFLEPYPEPLVTISDSGKGRELK